MPARILIVVFLALTTARIHADAFTVTNAADAGPGSLRQAIVDANAKPGFDVIEFALATSTISPATCLPAITDSVYIGAGRRGGVTLDGRNAGNCSGLNATAQVGIVNLTIARFVRHGIELDGVPSAFVTGSYIGTTPAHEAGSGNGGSGIFVRGSRHVEIIGNVVGDNAVGITLHASTDSAIAENGIGTDIFASGDIYSPLPVPNHGAGISIEYSSLIVIGLNPRCEFECIAASNAISNNEGAGIIQAGGRGNVVNQNSLRNNGGPAVHVMGGTLEVMENELGGNADPSIDLGASGREPNDALDLDQGPNAFQNAPTLVSAVTDGRGSTEVIGTLESAPDTTYRIDLLAGIGCGDADVPLRTNVYVTTDSRGHAEFTAVSRSELPPGTLVSATATTAGQTSENAQCIATTMGTPRRQLGVAISPAMAVTTAGSTVNFVIRLTNYGATELRNVNVTVAVDSSVITPLGFTTDPTCGERQCLVPLIIPGGTMALTWSGKVGDDAAPGTNRRVEVSASFGIEAEAAAAEVRVVSGSASTADLAIAVVAPPQSRRGDRFVGRVTVVNNGPGTSTGGMVTLHAPQSFEIAQWSQYCRRESCSLPALAAGAAMELTFTFAVRGQESGEITAVVTGGQPDPDPANNSASVSVDSEARLRAVRR